MRPAEVARILALFRITALPGGQTHVSMPDARRGRNKMGVIVPDAEAAAWAVRTYLIETDQV
jgi:hypothetical protein